MSDAASRTSEGSENSVIIEYSLVAVEEIRRHVVRGHAQFSRGGLEVGGVLYGSRDGRKVRIETIRPIFSEHADGPSFTLSVADRAKLDEQLAKDAQDSRLEKFVHLGWFVSHPRGELSLSEADVTIFSKYFREPWQVTLVVCPDRGVAMKAAFFVWEQDGTVRSDKSYKEFNFPDRLAGVIDTAPKAATRSASPVPSTPVGPTRIERTPSHSAFDSARYHPSPIPQRKIWPWVAAGAAALVMVLALGLQFWIFSPSESLGLIVTEREGQLQIEWTNTARAITRATSGSLNIIDGSAVQRIGLSRAQLSEGRYMYTRSGGDVEVRLEVENDGDTVHESSHFLGRAPIPVATSPALAEPPRTDPANAPITPAKIDPPKTNPATNDIEKSALQDENKRLRNENAALKQRIQQQERMQKILESRLGITGK